MESWKSDILDKIVFILSFRTHSNNCSCIICRIIGQKEGRALAETVTEAERDGDTVGIVICDGHLPNFRPQCSVKTASHKHRELHDRQRTFRMFVLSGVERACHFAQRETRRGESWKRARQPSTMK